MTDLVDSYLAHRFKWRPVDATFMGDTNHDHLLPPVTPDCIEQELAEIADLRAAADADTMAHPHDKLMIAAELTLEHARLSSRPLHHNPTWYTGEVGFGVISLLLPQSAPWRRDALHARLQAVPSYLRDGLARLDGQPTPKGWVERSTNEARALQVFLREDIRLHEAWGTDWGNACTTAAAALHEFASSLADLPDADPACGADHLEMVFKTCHALDISCEEALAQASAAFARCGDELVLMAKEIDPATSWQDQIGALADIHPATPHDVMDSYRHWDTKALDVAQAHGLVTPERIFGLEYRDLPACFTRIAAATYFLFYRSPPGLNPHDGSVYWVMPATDETLSNHNDAMVKAIHAVHHGSVGHHTQNARARKAPSRLGRIAATDCAMGLAFPAALTLVEGWACHVEDVMMEAPGFYTATEMLLLKSFERRNAASVLVDVNLHLKSWTMDQAERFYAEEAGFAPARVHSEVVRNSMFPGSRATYWLGVEGIRRLRQQWRGTTLDFHDTLLKYGHVPLACVKEAMKDAGQLIE